MYRPLSLALALALFATPAAADEIPVAMAANFAGPMKQIAADFEKASGHKLSVSAGATGKFSAQIQNGAPFEVFLSADETTPAKLAQEGLAVPGTGFTYAIGRLVLWSVKPGYVDAEGGVLKKNAFAHIALTNPKLAPYGAAAVEVLKSMNLLDSLTPKFVQGESIAQTQQFVATGNAELGFLALSQVQENGKLTGGSLWMVPSSMYSPLKQDAILLAKGKDKPGPAAFLDYLKSKKAQAVIKGFGYELPAEPTHKAHHAA